MNSIISILDNIDKKIEINNEINNNLLDQCKLIYTGWFRNFDPFIDDEFIPSEFGNIPKGWSVGKLGDIIEIFDSKRIPLSNQEREPVEKIYPYYGASSLMDYVDDYIFDGIYLLIGEDGTVIDSENHPILQYVWDKFWVNNHVHTIKGKNGFSTEAIYILLSKTNVQQSVTGAVQTKINQSNLKNITVIISSKEVLERFNNVLIKVFELYRNNSKEIEKLTKLRDVLLPKLMSGEIGVSGITFDLK